jgi:hypothetical protein
MFSANWLRGPRIARRGDRRRKYQTYRIRPQFEVLEGRALPSILMVTNNSDTGVSGDGSLRGEIAAAASGDTIEFAGNVQGQTITLSKGELALSKNLDTEGGGGNPIVISGNDASRVFDISSATVTLSGLTITQGSGTGSGAGIYNTGTLTVSQCTLSQNHAGMDGGGIWNNGTLTVNQSTLSDNQAAATLNNGSGGGGIFNAGTLTVSNSTMTGNTAVFLAGSIFNAGTLTVSNSTLSGNSADNGGGFYNVTGGMLMVSNSTLSGNHAIHGGGIFKADGTLTLVNTIVAHNTGNLNAYTDVYDRAVVSTSRYNLIGDGTGMSGISNGVNGNQVGTYANPIDPRLGPLQDNGGPTQTMALLAGSPALDAGDPAQLGTTDQRGELRLGGVNIGAYQALAASFQLSTVYRSVLPGQPLAALTVTATDRFGKLAPNYRGTVHFSCTDPQASSLPADYTFTATDNGQHTFSAGITLFTPGSQTITVSAGANGLISAWLGEGNPLDVMGRNNGSVAGGVTYAAGKVGQAFSFDGTGQVLVNDAPSLDLTSAVSLEAWINPSTLAFRNGFGAVIAKSATGCGTTDSTSPPAAPCICPISRPTEPMSFCKRRTTWSQPGSSATSPRPSTLARATGSFMSMGNR